VDIVDLLIDIGQPVPLEKFTSSPQVQALYRKVAASTWYRDFAKMNESALIKISVDDDTKIAYIELNFSVLDLVTYNVR
jgi:hypothetical protein